eukprot:gene30488-45005_t
MDTPGIVNRVQVSDLVAPKDEPADWFGNAFHRRTTTITSALFGPPIQQGNHVGG